MRIDEEGAQSFLFLCAFFRYSCRMLRFKFVIDLLCEALVPMLSGVTVQMKGTALELTKDGFQETVNNLVFKYRALQQLRTDLRLPVTDPFATAAAEAFAIFADFDEFAKKVCF